MAAHFHRIRQIESQLRQVSGLRLRLGAIDFHPVGIDGRGWWDREFETAVGAAPMACGSAGCGSEAAVATVPRTLARHLRAVPALDRRTGPRTPAC